MKQLLIATALLVLTGGCRLIQPPEGFIMAKDPGPYALKAFNADAVTLGLRLEDNEDSGTLSFWKKAVVNEKTRQTGYKLVSEEQVKTRQGLAGHLLTFQATLFGKPYLYVAAVFATHHHVAIIEVGGEAKFVEPEKKNILRAIRTLRHKWFVFRLF